MQKHILPFALLSLLACQQQPTPASVATGEFSASSVNQGMAAAEPAAAHGTDLPGNKPKQVKDYNLASLIAKEKDDHEIMNGFYGPDHYRIEFAILKVRQDSTNPAHYFVQGKNRYKKVVTSFAGDILFGQLKNQPLVEIPLGEANRYGEELNQQQMYSAIGTFRWQESSRQPGSGTFEGQAVVDFQVDDDGQLTLSSRDENTGAMGGGILLKGHWSSSRTRQRKALTLVSNILSFQQDIFEKFMIGERDPDFNPKYAKLGWNTYWQNDEWWAEPGPEKENQPKEEQLADVTLAVTDSR